MEHNFSEKANFIWSVADLLRGDYKRSEYGRVILPLTVLRRLDCVLEPTKDRAMKKYEEVKDKADDPRPFLKPITGQQVYNVSPFTFARLLDAPDDIAANLRANVAGFDPATRDVLNGFRFDTQIDRLDRSRLLYQVVSRFCDIDLHPDVVQNTEMGWIYEELVRRFSEMSNETAGEHFTPREVIRLMVNLLFIEDEDGLSKRGVVRTLYDPACGTGGMLSVAEDWLRDHNPNAKLEVYGQELNDETFAICWSDMVLKGQDASNIYPGNSFTEDGTAGQTFNYMLANPPFGVEWKKVADHIRAEHETQGFRGRFGAGLPRINDGSLLFLQHMLSKMKDPDVGGSRLAIVFNGSPLFTGSAGSGESEIRRWIIENDWLEAVVALPEQIFYNTGIATYFWVLTNRKSRRRRGKVQLVDAREGLTLARDHSLTFLDHALRHGDSLVGLEMRQIENFHWDPKMTWDSPFRQRLREHTAKVAELRARIRQAGEDVSDFELRDLWDQARFEADRVRLYGDLVLAAFFEGDKPKAREERRTAYVDAVVKDDAEQYRPWLEDWRHADPPLAPFHWELEFPEVFDRDNPGFDAIVGNPPFGGKNTIAAANLERYLNWLKHIHEDSHGNADQVAHFFRRAFDLIREDGTFGLLATNTIAQGDTRGTGLRWICTHGGEIYNAAKRYKWPGMAAVVVSVLHVMKGTYPGAKLLDGREVEVITAFLFHRGGHDDPVRLAANAGKSFQGSIVLGMGFTFDESDTKGVATPIAEMERLIAKDSSNADVIFPYIGGEEVNTSPTQAHDRYVINFGERTEEESRKRWPDLMAIVEEKVKPDRMKVNREVRRRYWWRFAEPALALYAAIAGLDRVLAISRVGNAIAFAFLPSGFVYADRLVVFSLCSYGSFTVLQSRVHETWARFFSYTFKDDFAYGPSDCFETFPFPEGWDTHPTLEAAGEAYYAFRANLMVRNDEGLTKTYNRFHNPDERDSEIHKLRVLHAAMDRAVLDACGWSDIPTACEFLLDYEIDEDEWGTKKKPYRYRWPDEVRDEVLARLLALNATRAAAESRSGTATGSKKSRRRSAPRTSRASAAPRLFGET